VIYWVNYEGRICLAAGAVLGFIGAGLGKLAGPYLGLGELGYVLGPVVGGLGIIVVDVGIRLRAVLEGRAGLVGAFFWPSYGGTVNWFHASFDGVLFIALGVWLVTISWNIAERAKKEEAARREEARLKSITRELPRDSILVDLAEKKTEWTATLTNSQGKDFAKVVVRYSFSAGRDYLNRTVEWPTWKDGETRSFTEKARQLPLDSLGFDIEAYPPGADQPRYHMWVPGRVQKGKWTASQPSG
jgi:hypothetical protein